MTSALPVHRGAFLTRLEDGMTEIVDALERRRGQHDPEVVGDGLIAIAQGLESIALRMRAIARRVRQKGRLPDVAYAAGRDVTHLVRNLVERELA
jgi:hypothetical protein